MPLSQCYRLQWDAGAFAELDVFRPDVHNYRPDDGIGYQLRYVPPFRSTFRPRVRELGLTPQEINDIVGEGVDRLTTIVNAGGVGSRGAATLGASQSHAAHTTRDMQLLGRRLLSILEQRRNVLNDLRTGLFLSVGMDEGLLTYPWELMYDDEFYCLKHKMGRVVNGYGPDSPAEEGKKWWGERLEDFRILLIDVSRTEIRDGYRYPQLPQARVEADAIEAIVLASDVGVECVRLRDEDATRENVLNTLFEKEFKIIHFCGHGEVDPHNPRNSSLVLFDAAATTRVIATAFSETRPLLCFINACQSAEEDQVPRNAKVYTIGRAFLETGAYLLGNRWKISDPAAKAFAEEFYASLLREGKPLGEAVRLARLKCRDQLSNDLGWASYVFYRDPRVRFQREDAPVESAARSQVAKHG